MRRCLLQTFESPLMLLPLAVCVAACGAGRTGEVTGTQGADIVNPASPITGTPSAADLSPLSVSGSFSNVQTFGGVLAHTLTSTGQFSTYSDLGTTPDQTTGSPPSTSTWLGRVSSFATAPNFASDLTTATNAALSAAAPNTSEVTSLLTSPAIEAIFGNPNVGSPSETLYGWHPVAGRYLRSEYAANLCIIGHGCSETQFTFSDPPQLAEQRQRGARFYCAARLAQRTQGANTLVMGQEPAVSFSLLGTKINLLVVEPMVSIEGPQKYTKTTADGAQAFMIPMKFGTRVTPIQAWGLPSLPELRYPVAFVTGDSEVVTPADVGTVNGTANVYQKDYLTVEHMDGFVGSAVSAQANNTFPLFTIGPVSVNLQLGLAVAAGPNALATGNLMQGVLWYLPPARPTFPATASFMDGPWNALDLANSCPNCVLQAPVQPLPGGPIWVNGTASFADALQVRALEDDDHYLQGGQAGVTLNAALSGSLGLDYGPLTLSFNLVAGAMTGSVAMDHMVRDAAFAQIPSGSPSSGMTAVTGVTVRPRTVANVSLQPLSASLQASINFGFFSDSWTIPLFSTGSIPLASYDTDTTNTWPAASQLRLGTGSSLGDIQSDPTVDTQLPGATASVFEAMPSNVATCLADTTPNAGPAPVCGSTPASGKANPPHLNLCAYAKDVQACSSVGSSTKLNSTSAGACRGDIAMYLCGLTPHYGPGGYDYGSVGATQLQTLGNELKTCGNLEYNADLAAGMSKAAAEADADTFVESLIGLTPCDSNAHPVSGSAIFSAPNPTTPPAATAGGTCN